MKINDIQDIFKNMSETSKTKIIENTLSSDLLIVNVNGTSYDLKISGAMEDNVYTVLSPIKMSDYSIVDSITSNGIYTVSVGGVKYVKFEVTSNTNSLNVLGKLGD